MRGWGPTNSLRIGPITRGGVSFWRVEGSSGTENAGFSTVNTSSSEPIASLVVGEIFKSRDGQVSFLFILRGLTGEYNLVFVHGPLVDRGWVGRAYFEPLNASSSRLLDFAALLRSRGETFSRLETAALVVQANLTVTLDFRLHFAKATLTPPTRIQPGAWVSGNLSLPGVRVSSQITYNQTGYHERAGFVYSASSQCISVDRILTRGWKIVQVLRSGETCTTSALVYATRAVPLPAALPSERLDAVFSLQSLGPATFLFLGVLAVSIFHYFVNFRGRGV